MSGSAKKVGSAKSNATSGGWFTCAKCGKRLPRSASGKHVDGGCGEELYPYIQGQGQSQHSGQDVATFALVVNATTTSSKLFSYLTMLSIMVIHYFRNPEPPLHKMQSVILQHDILTGRTHSRVGIHDVQLGSSELCATAERSCRKKRQHLVINSRGDANLANSGYNIVFQRFWKCDDDEGWLFGESCNLSKASFEVGYQR